MKVCPDCTYEQTEAAHEAKRWEAYLKTNPRLPQNPLPLGAFVGGKSRNATGVSSRNPSQSHAKKTVADNSEHECHACGMGGELLCCSFCPLVFHMDCLEPPLDSVPKGKWACPQCEVSQPRKPDKPKSSPFAKELDLGGHTRNPRKRQRSLVGGSGFLDTVPSDMTFNQQIELALIQSKRDAERQARRARELGEAGQVLAEAFTSSRAHDRSSSEDEVSPPLASTRVKSQVKTEEIVDEFVIEEAADIMEFDGFRIVAQGGAPTVSAR